MCRIILLLTLLIGTVLPAQTQLLQYNAIRETYSHLPENDTAALPAVYKSISLAKKSHNTKHLIYAMEDALYYSANKIIKLKYADSIIQASKLANDYDLLAKAYLGKGIVYYYNFQQYDNALKEYLNAVLQCEKTKNPYLNHKVAYHIGIVKSYLGFYEEAKENFTNTANYFDKQRKLAKHDDLIFNNTRGYLNSLHQLMICDRNLQQIAIVDSILKLNINALQKREYEQENAYFKKELGIQQFRQKNYAKAIPLLNTASRQFKSRKESRNLATAYFYMGKSWLQLNHKEEGLSYLQKIDSIFNAYYTINPEIRMAYDILLREVISEKNPELLTYYSKQVMKSDSILQHDLPFLSSKIYREYDARTLRQAKNTLDREKKLRNYIIIFAIAIACVLLLFLILSKLKQNRIKESFRILQIKLANES